MTEEVFPGYKFSRASYLAGLLRPSIIEELNLAVRAPVWRTPCVREALVFLFVPQQYGFKYLPRNPSSFTPSLVDGPNAGKYLMLGDDADMNKASIAQVCGFTQPSATCVFCHSLSVRGTCVVFPP